MIFKHLLFGAVIASCFLSGIVVGATPWRDPNRPFFEITGVALVALTYLFGAFAL